MEVTDEIATEQMRKAIAAYAGPVMRCPPGKARAPAEPVEINNGAVEWLRRNRSARPLRSAKVTRRQMQIARAQQQRIAKRNAKLLKRLNARL